MVVANSDWSAQRRVERRASARPLQLTVRRRHRVNSAVRLIRLQPRWAQVTAVSNRKSPGQKKCSLDMYAHTF